MFDGRTITKCGNHDHKEEERAQHNRSMNV